jgi:hypothetical protein
MMADKDSLLQYVAQQMDPEQLQQMVDQVEQELSQDPEVMADGAQGIQELINQLSFVAENPESYKDVVTSAIQSGFIDPEDAPPEFDPMFIAVMILALEELKARMSTGQGFAKGGLAKAAKHLAAQGRGGDTMLAHINPREAEVLRRMGGTGTINPNTGLHEFKKGILKSIGKVFKSVAKIALPIAATAIGGPWAGAAVGAGLGAMDGGGLKGAILGGLSGGLAPGGVLGGFSKTVGSGITSMLPSSIGNALTSVISPATLGSTVLGGLGSTVLGKGFLPGALMAGGMSAMAPTVEGLVGSAKNYLTGPGGVFSSQAGGTGINLGNVPAGGAGVNLANATGPGVNLGTFDPGAAIKDSTGNILTNLGSGSTAAANAGNVAGAAPSTGLFGSGISAGNVLTGLTALNALGGMSIPDAQMAIQNAGLTEEQKAAMNRELTDYTARWNTTTLPQSGTPEYTELMDRIQRGIGVNFMNPTITTPQTAMAKGGALSNVAMLARGTGHGRSDTINARLSDGEYVIDAETVALLGNGSTKAGASALDQMREQLRKQKGKSLAKGKFSPDAKSPLAYLKGGVK